MYKLFMALRYLRAHRIIYFSIAGVAVGIMVMVITSSVMGGFSRDMRARIRGMQADLTLTTGAPNLYLPEYESLVERIKKIPHVIGASPRLEHSAWLSLGHSRRVVTLIGIDPKREKETSGIDGYFREGTKSEFSFYYDDRREQIHPGIVVGIDRYWPPTTGAIGVMDDTPPRVINKEFEVVGFFRSGMSEYDAGMSVEHGGIAFVELSAMQDFMGGRGNVLGVANQIAIKLDDYHEHLYEVRRAIHDITHQYHECLRPYEHERGRCGKYLTLSWEEAKRNLLAAVNVEKGIMGLVLFFIVIVAGFNILAIYTLMVRAKTKDVGILKALGASEGGITGIFLISGTVCGLVGCVLGILAGLFLAQNINEIADFIEDQSKFLNVSSMENVLYPNPLVGPAKTLARLIPLVVASGAFTLCGLMFRKRHFMAGGLLGVFGLIMGFLGLSALLGQMDERAIEWLTLSCFLGSLFVLSWSWIRFYGKWHGVNWGLAGGAAVLLVLGAFFFFGWMNPTGELENLYDASEVVDYRAAYWWILFGCLAFPFAMTGIQKGLSLMLDSGLRYMGVFAATAVWFVGMILILGAWALSSGIIAQDPPPNFPGYHLFPKDIYYLEEIPVYIDTVSISMLVGLTLVVSLVFSIYPAKRAAALDPIEAIREE